MSKELEKYRELLLSNDQKLIDVLKERYFILKEISLVKKQGNIAIHQDEIWQIQHEKRKVFNLENAVPTQDIDDIFKLLHQLSIQFQEKNQHE